MSKILVTGFEPFGGDTVNPALEAIKVLEGRLIGNCQVVTRALPVVKGKSIAAIAAYIEEVKPELVLAVGQAYGRPDITFERVAINVDDFRIKDNEGNQPVDDPIIVDGPAAYWSTLPIKAMVEAVRAGGIPASVSNTAGTFVCNHLFYGLMHTLAQKPNPCHGGFVHIPYLPEQAAQSPGQSSMALETIVCGLELALAAALTTGCDVKITGGAIS